MHRAEPGQLLVVQVRAGQQNLDDINTLPPSLQGATLAALKVRHMH
jgi:hypothetical protein